MKTSLFLILFLITAHAFSQQNFLAKLWVTDDKQYVTADSAAIRFETFSKSLGNIRVAAGYHIMKDTISMWRNIDRKDIGTFLFDTSKKQSFVLTPLNEPAKQLITQVALKAGRTQLIFYEIDQVYTDTIRFERIVFNATTCYGFCPSMSLQIDSDKTVRFIGGKFAARQGSYNSVLSNQQYGQLLNLLKTADLDVLISNRDRNIDLPTYTIELYYNDKIRLLRTCMLPFVTDKLRDFLLEIPGKIPLTESGRPMKISFISPDVGIE